MIPASKRQGVDAVEVYKSDLLAGARTVGHVRISSSPRAA